MASKKLKRTVSGKLTVLSFNTVSTFYFMVASIFLSTRNLMNSVSPC